jgi:hypothetical protein
VCGMSSQQIAYVIKWVRVYRKALKNEAKRRSSTEGLSRV